MHDYANVPIPNGKYKNNKKDMSAKKTALST